MTAVNTTGLGAETSMVLSQSMDSVNTTPDDEGMLDASAYTCNEVRTLFVSGLPMDAKPRELYLLFRAYKGYETSLLKMMGKVINKPNSCGYEGSLLKVTGKNGKTTSPVGFVTFNSRVAAETAKQDLQGVKFDPDLPQTLRLEFAKSNTKVTKPKQQSPQPAATHPTHLIHQLTGQEFGAAFFPGPETWAAHVPMVSASYAELTPTAAMHHPGLIQAHPGLAQVAIRHQHQPLHHALAMAGHPAAVTPNSAMSHPHLAASPVLGSPVGGATTLPVGASNAPCSTLFVANLGPFCSEQELKDLFASFPGFSRLRMHNKGGHPVAFVEYQDLRFATEAMQRLQGFVLLSSERGGMRIEYAKNKMGEMALLLPGSLGHAVCDM